MAVDICIRGAGPVGRTLALLLARERIRVALVEPATTAASSTSGTPSDIRAFALNAASRELLGSLRVWLDEATPVQHMQVFGDGSEARQGQVRFDAKPDEALSWIVPAQPLMARLDAALSFAPEVQRVSQAVPAALTVICEGRHSTSRAEDAAWHSFAYGQNAVAAILTSALPHESTAWQWMGADDADGHNPHDSGEICACLPLGESAPGNQVALVWSVAQARAKDLLALDEAAFCEALQAHTHERLGAFILASPRATWPLMVAQAEHWIGTGLEDQPQARWVLAGDAAHAVHPLAGQGLNLGLADAKELAGVLAGKPSFRGFADERLLRAYERARKGDAAALRLATDGLQRLFASKDMRLKTLRNWGMQTFDTLAPLKSLIMRRASGL
jgi:2-polyprenyl-6-methoxyphenol hydroxylase-like FAD-dependent oxidoreductase